MASNKPDLTRAGTMDITAKEGKTFLDRNLTEWKKPYLMSGDDSGEDASGSQEEEKEDKKTASVEKASPRKPRLSKDNTMLNTAKEGKTFLDRNLTEWKKPYLMSGDDSGEDASGSQEEEKEDKKTASVEKASPRKPRLSKDNTMLNTAKEAKTLLSGEKLSDTRAETKASKARRASKLKRASTMAKAKQEAEAVYGEDLDLAEGRSLRKRARVTSKPSLKKTGTMAATAKEGKAFLKRGKKGKKSKK